MTENNKDITQTYWNRYYREKNERKFRAIVCQKASIVKFYLKTGFTKDVELDRSYKRLSKCKFMGYL